MSPTGRPEGEFAPKRVSVEGSPVSPTGRLEGEFAPKRVSAEGSPVSPTGRPEGEFAPKRVSAEGSPVSPTWRHVPGAALTAGAVAIDPAPDAGRAALAATLDAGLARLRIALPAASRDKLLDYIGLLARWNKTYNLTAIRAPARMVTHHLLDCLAALPTLERLAAGRLPLRVLDVGSGGGLPGIPIAVARGDWRVTLVEPSQKKGAFLVQAVAELGIANTDVAIARVEDVLAAGRYDLVVSRAFADLAAFARATLRHVAAEGFLVAMKGVHPDAELAELPPQVRVSETVALDVPFVDGARHLVVMRRSPEPSDAPSNGAP